MQRCLFCGGDASEPDHAARCDGRQGHVEAEAPFEPEPDPPRPPYFDAARGTALAERGIRQAFTHAKEQNKDAARLIIQDLAATRPFFTSEDVWKRCAETPGHTIDPRRGSFLGHLLREAARDGLIALLPADFPSERPANHCRILRVWRSLIYRGAGALPVCHACGRIRLPQSGT